MTKSSINPSYSLDYVNRSVLPSLMKHKYSWPFLKTVDYIALNIPDYPNIVRHPIDFSKVKEKLRMNQYASVTECLTDISTIFSNCYLFNQPGEDIVYMALHLDLMLKKKMKGTTTNGDDSQSTNSHFSTPGGNARRNCDLNVSSLLGKRKIEEKPNLTPKIARLDSTKIVSAHVALDSVDLAKCNHVLKEIMSSKYQHLNTLFLHPVDVKKLNLFDYYDIIKKPMDLGTIQSKLGANLYDTKEKFLEEVVLVFNNCIKYNGEGSEFAKVALKIRDIFRDMYAKTFNSNKPSETTKKPMTSQQKPQENEVQHRPALSKPNKERPQRTDECDKKQILEMLNKLEKQQDDLMQKSKKIQDLILVQNAEIEELYQKCVGSSIHDRGDNNNGDACSLISTMSESILSTSTSIISNSRNGKRQIRPPKNQLNESLDTPPSVNSKKSLPNNVKNSGKKSLPNNIKKEEKISKKDEKVTKPEPINKARMKVVEQYKPMTYDEKKQLYININQILHDQLGNISKIIRRYETSIIDFDNYEMDIEVLQPITLRELEKFANNCIAASKLRPPPTKKTDQKERGQSRDKDDVSSSSSISSTDCSSSSSDSNQSIS